MKNNLFRNIILSFIFTILVALFIKIVIMHGAMEDFTIRYDLEYMLNSAIESGLYQHPVDPDDPLLKERKIMISKSIDELTAQVVSEKLFYLDQIGNEPIDLIINTNGGWGNSAFQIIETMNQIDSKVNTIALGRCYSSGAIILVAGTGIRKASENTIIMLHANLTEYSDSTSYDYYYTSRYENVWKENSEIPEEWYPMTRDKSYYLDPEKALNYRIIDEILPSKHKREPESVSI